MLERSSYSDCGGSSSDELGGGVNVPADGAGLKAPQCDLEIPNRLNLKEDSELADGAIICAKHQAQARTAVAAPSTGTPCFTSTPSARAGAPL
ncbi:hypothetical protein EYF80_029419 [Liparis tanakae]|uniref:Uncharacterized protein n=1 Tax=Liparis tanakae TaxID=230148 RepID=A0A4Z2H3A0_9TELE|nr:hypothetical protein EYF80_029419 [Liparis tanakae]